MYCYGVKEYLLNNLGNVTVADAIRYHVGTLTSLLGERSCRLIKPIEIDFDYLELLDGYCFDIPVKTFTKTPRRLKGSPQAFVKYQYVPGEVPTPLKFIEGQFSILLYSIHRVLALVILILFSFRSGVENSFPNPLLRRRFYQKYYQIFLHRRFPMKEPKVCLVGPPDRGKTSWFCPFQGIHTVFTTSRFQQKLFHTQSINPFLLKSTGM